MIRINCDLCGKIEGNLKRTIIENVKLNVCSNCSKFGRVIGPVKPAHDRERTKKIEPQEKIELLVENYAEIIKRKRESIGLTQKDFANKISEKEATIHKIETESLEPSLSLARKLEKILGIKLVDGHLETHKHIKTKKIEGFTLGDFIKAK